MIEVLRQIESQELSETYCHKRVAAEVKVDLERVRENAHPCEFCGYRVIADIGDVRPKVSYLICENDLASETYREVSETLIEALDRMLALSELFGDRFICNDRTCYKLREHRDISAVVYE